MKIRLRALLLLFLCISYFVQAQDTKKDNIEKLEAQKAFWATRHFKHNFDMWLVSGSSSILLDWSLDSVKNGSKLAGQIRGITKENGIPSVALKDYVWDIQLTSFSLKEREAVIQTRETAKCIKKNCDIPSPTTRTYTLTLESVLKNQEQSDQWKLVSAEPLL
jgi:hypothetical protein